MATQQGVWNESKGEYDKKQRGVWYESKGEYDKKQSGVWSEAKWSMIRHKREYDKNQRGVWKEAKWSMYRLNGSLIRSKRKYKAKRIIGDCEEIKCE